MMKHESQVCNDFVTIANEEELKNCQFVDSNSLKLYSIYDKKLKQYLPPFFAKSDDEAMRQVSSIVNYTSSLICKFPDDYSLVTLGKFNLDTGDLISDFNHLSDNLSVYKLQDSIKYDELLKEVQIDKQQLSSILCDYEKIHSEYERKIRLLDTKIQEFENKFYNVIKCEEPVELYTPKPELSKQKRTFLDKLFS